MPSPTVPKLAVVVMGVSGCGKTTVADELSDRLGWPVAEADDFHSAANKEKMSSGVPLTDADREPWLVSLRDWIDGADGNVILTCSALKRRYRDVLRTAEARVVFLHLDGSPALLAERMKHRTGHFMPTSLLQSQLATLEPLEPDEDGAVIDVALDPDAIVARALDVLHLEVSA